MTELSPDSVLETRRFDSTSENNNIVDMNVSEDSKLLGTRPAVEVTSNNTMTAPSHPVSVEFSEKALDVEGRREDVSGNTVPMIVDNINAALSIQGALTDALCNSTSPLALTSYVNSGNNESNDFSFSGTCIQSQIRTKDHNTSVPIVVSDSSKTINTNSQTYINSNSTALSCTSTKMTHCPYRSLASIQKFTETPTGGMINVSPPNMSLLPHDTNTVAVNPMMPPFLYPNQRTTDYYGTTIGEPDRLLASHRSSRNAPLMIHHSNNMKRVYPCVDFQHGKCTRGNDCRFAHVSLDDISAEIARQTNRESYQYSNQSTDHYSPFNGQVRCDFPDTVHNQLTKENIINTTPFNMPSKHNRSSNFGHLMRDSHTGPFVFPHRAHHNYQRQNHNPSHFTNYSTSYTAPRYASYHQNHNSHSKHNNRFRPTESNFDTSLSQRHVRNNNTSIKADSALHQSHSNCQHVTHISPAIYGPIISQPVQTHTMTVNEDLACSPLHRRGNNISNPSHILYSPEGESQFILPSPPTNSGKKLAYHHDPYNRSGSNGIANTTVPHTTLSDTNCDNSPVYVSSRASNSNTSEVSKTMCCSPLTNAPTSDAWDTFFANNPSLAQMVEEPLKASGYSIHDLRKQSQMELDTNLNSQISSQYLRFAIWKALHPEECAVGDPINTVSSGCGARQSPQSIIPSTMEEAESLLHTCVSNTPIPNPTDSPPAKEPPYG